MVPVAEYHPSEDGTDYVLFRCLACETAEKRDWDTYWRYRPQSFDCVKCGKRVWSVMVKRCPSCATPASRVNRLAWTQHHHPSTGQWLEEYVAEAGCLYTPEERAELEAHKAE